jgi:hypothetical protein
MPHNAELIYEAQSLEELFQVLEHSQAPALPHGGWVRIHPDRLTEPGLEEYVTARARAALFGLRLVITPYVKVGTVELRRRSASLSARRVSGEGD